MNLTKIYKSYPRVIWILAISTTINVAGNAMIFPLNTLYITKILGGSIAIAGIILTIQQGLILIGNFIGGAVYDKLGPKITIKLGVIFSIVILISLTFINNIILYAILLALLGLSGGFILPSTYALVGSIWPEGGRKTFNVIYVAQNLGVAIGPIIGGIVFDLAPSFIFTINAITFIIFYFLIFLGIKKDDWKIVLNDSIETKIKLSTREKLQSLKNNNYLSLIILSLAFLLSWIPYSQWATTISVHITNIGIDYSKYTLLWSLNGLLIVLGQPIISLITNKVITDLRNQIKVGNIIFMLGFFIIVIFNTNYMGFVSAMVIMSFAEMLVWPAVPAIAADLAPKKKIGFYQGIISASGAGGRMIGVLIGGILFDLIGLTNLMIIMIILIFIAGILYSNFKRFSDNNNQV